MSSVSRCLVALGLMCLWGSTGSAADELPVFSGPQAGEALSALNVIIPYGEKRGEHIDFIEAAGGKPTLLVVVKTPSRATGAMTRALMHYSEMHSQDGLFGAVVWLSDDRSDAEKFLISIRGGLGAGSPVGISLDSAEGPGSYGFNRNVSVTVLVANHNRVTANFPLIQASMTDVPKILQEVVKQTGGTVPTMPQIEFLSMPETVAKPGRWETESHDVELRRQLCEFVDAKDDAEAAVRAEKIEAYVSDNAKLGEQLHMGATVISRSRANSQPTLASAFTAPYAQKWLEVYGDKGSDSPRMRAR